MEMEEREELRKELEEELRWIKYRQRMLDIIEDKLLQMRKLVKKAENDNVTAEELKEINARINNLAIQIEALDSESRSNGDSHF